MAGPGTTGEETRTRRISRRALLAGGLGGLVVLAAGGATAVELVEHGVLPGRQALDQLTGGCDATPVALDFGAVGPSFSGTFDSAARRRTVGYTIAYPPGHTRGDALPLVVMLHGFGANHSTALSGMTPAQALALRVGGRPLAPMAMVTVDGGGGYWTPHPGDDPMGMVVHELVPMCQGLGLGRAPDAIGTMGISMGGYGAIVLAERFPRLFRAVAAISPAIFPDYAQARTVNPGAFAGQGAFATYDVVTGAPALERTPVRVASGADDPFHPGVERFAAALPSATVVFPTGCHTGPFFTSEEPASLAFLAAHLGSVAST